MAVTGVVTVLPVADSDLGMEEGEPLVHVQTFLAEPPVERLDEAVTPWFTGRDVSDVDLVLTKGLECVGNQFGSVVAADCLGPFTACDERSQSSHDIFAGDRPGGDVKERFAGVLVNG